MKRFSILAVIAVAIVSLLAPSESSAADDKKKPDVRELKNIINRAYLSQDASVLREVLLRFGRQNSREAVRAVLDQAAKFAQADDAEDWYWALVEGAASYNRPLACSEMGDFIVQYRTRPISKDLLHSLQKNNSKYVTRILRRVFDRGTDDLKALAIDIAAQLPYRRTVDVLMPYYAKLAEKDSAQAKQMRKRAVIVLEALTKQRIGDSLINWQGWWEANRHKGLKVIRAEAEEWDGATGIARKLDPVRAAQFIGLEEFPEGKVLVVEGPVARNGVDTNNDDISAKLSTLNIPHDTVLKERLEESNYSIDRYAAVFVNCTQIHRFCQSPGHRGGKAVGNRMRECLGPNPHDNAQFKMKRPALEKLKKWVNRGGYLFTEDWVLAEAVAPNWPALVKVGSKLEEDNVQIRPAKGKTTHSFLRGVFVPPVSIEDFDWDSDDEDDEVDIFGESDKDEKKQKEKDAYDPTVEDDEEDAKAEKSGGGSGSTGVGEDPVDPESEKFDDPKISIIQHEWKIDNESNAITVRSKKVETLITSQELRKKAGDPAVAISFVHGRGKVLHVLSHFGKQTSAKNEASIENLLINFLIEVKVRVMR